MRIIDVGKFLVADSRTCWILLLEESVAFFLEWECLFRIIYGDRLKELCLCCECVRLV